MLEEEIIKRLTEFTKGYLPEEKLDKIRESIIFEIDSKFKERGYSPNTMGFNTGKQSILSLAYDLDILKANANHESIHQISDLREKVDLLQFGWGPYELQRISGVYYSIREYETGKRIIHCKGINECLTELFNKITMGNEYPEDIFYCNYQDGVLKLEEIIDTGIISMDELKQYYFSNEGEELLTKLDRRGREYGIESLGRKLEIELDGAISNDYEIRKEALNNLNKIIKDLSLRMSL